VKGISYMAEERVRIRPGGGNGTTSDEASAVGRSETAAPAVQQVEAVRERAVPDGFDLGRDRVHWGPIVAGLLTALTTLLLLSLLGLAVGLTTVNAGTAAAQGTPPPDAGRNSALWAGLAGILAFLLGGYMAARTAAVFSRGWGALNGALVFMLAVPLILWLAGQGLGTVLGSLGSLSGALASNPATTQAAQGAASQAQAAAQSVQPIDVARAAEAARNTAWGTLAGALLGLGASALGGWLGTRHPTATQRTTRHIVR
jgi:hypothetical protein